MSPPNATLPKPPTLNPYILQNSSKPSAIRNTAPKTTNTESPTVIKPYGSDRVDISALAYDPNADQAGTEKDKEERIKEQNSATAEDGFSLANFFRSFKVRPATERNKIVAFQQRQQQSPENFNSFKSFAAIA
jgi:hypothetical protein